MNYPTRILAILVSLLPAVSVALEIGFESSLFAEISDTDNRVPEREQSGIDGTLGTFNFALFGQEQSDIADGGFMAELRAERIFENDNDTSNDNETFTRFYGGLSVATPLRSLNWYVGDVLAAVLDEDQLQSIDDNRNRQVNVFVTGPEISTQVGVQKTLDTSFYYVNQTDDTDNDLDTLYNLRANFTSLLAGGRSWGVRLSDIYTDKPDSALNSEDFNRASGALFIARQRSVTTLDVELGATQYYSNGEGTNGLRFGLDWSRLMSETQTLSLSVSHDLIDQTLGVLQELTTGEQARDETDGVAENTAVNLRYESIAGVNSFVIGVGAVNSDFRLAADESGFTSRNTRLRDSVSYALTAGFSRDLTARTSINLDASLQRREFVNRPDEIDSLGVIGAFRFDLNNRWAIELGGGYLEETGVTTTINDVEGTVSQPLELDEVDTRVFIGLRWAPPTRASRDAGGVVRSFL